MKKLIPLFVFMVFGSAGIVMAQSDASFQAGEKAYGLGNYSAAVDHYSRYIKTYEDQVPGYIKKMHSYDTSNAYQRTALFPGFSVNRDWSAGYYKRGLAELKTSDFTQAGKDFDMAIAVDPAYGPPYFQKGLLSKGKGKNISCVYFSRALALGDTMKEAKNEYRDNFCWMCGMEFFSKGKTEIDLKHFEEGLKNLNIAISYCHDSGNYYAYRGIAYEGLGNLDSAIADYTSAIKIDSGSYMGYYRRALTYEKAQKYKEEFDDLNKAILINSKFGDAYLHQAEACENLNMPGQALYDYQQVLHLKPSAGIAWYKIGLNRQQNGQDACSYFEKAVDLGCEDAQSYADDCKKAEARRALK